MSTSDDFLNALQNQKPDEAWALIDEGDVEAEAAWKDFLLEYDTVESDEEEGSSLMWGQINEFSHDGIDVDEKRDILVYIQEKLKENDFRRLREYSAKNNSTFETYLYRINHRLILDFLDKKTGERDLPDSVEELSELKQKIFRERFQKRKSPLRIYKDLKLEQSEYNPSREKVKKCLEEVHEVWANLRSDAKKGILPNNYAGLDVEVMGTLTSPDRELFNNEFRKKCIQPINDELNELSEIEQLILKLYYDKKKDLSADDVAEAIPDCENARKVYDTDQKFKDQCRSAIDDDYLDLIVDNPEFSDWLAGEIDAF